MKPQDISAQEVLRDQEFARFYDLEYSDYTEDVEFYLQYAEALDPERNLPVLELGCGTGRVLLALAEQGFRVTGIDRSRAMLARCECHAEERGLKPEVTLLQRDLEKPGKPAGPYNLAYCALNTFAYLTTTSAQLTLLEAVRPVLVQHGILILDLTPPMPHLLPPADNEVLHQGSYRDPESGSLVHKLVTGYARPSEQLHIVRLIYDVEAPDGTLRRFSREDVFRWTGRFEMELLLRAAGFTLEQVYGSYELDPYRDTSERMIFVART